MNNCLNCGKEIVQKEFGKPRKFCDNNNSCKQSYHNKNKKEKRFVRFDSFQALKEKFDMVVAENNELKLAKSVPNQKEEPLRTKITYQKATKEAYDGNKADRYVLDEIGLTMPAETPKIDEKERQARIKQLEYELAHAPKTFSISGMKYHYFNSRETELKKLRTQNNIS
jgi:hypothetical protein